MSVDGSGDSHYVELLESKFRKLLNHLLLQIEVMKTGICPLTRRPRCRAGLLKSGRAHYISAGYFENRLPRPIQVDEEYLAEYPDVGEAIRGGAVSSAAQHFEHDGFKEGRLPEAGWPLLATRIDQDSVTSS